MNDNIRVKYATMENLDSWMQLVGSMRQNFPGLSTAEEIEGYRETVKKFIGRNTALCALDGNTVVGFLLFSPKHNMLCHMGVCPEYRRKGIASAMIRQMLQSLDRSRDIVVTTFRAEDEKGTAPRALYEKFGFEPGELCFDMNYPEQKFILRAAIEEKTSGNEENGLLARMLKCGTELLKKRYPTGWGCACVIRSIHDDFFTSVYMDTISCSADLCFETGAICDAHKQDVFCTHSLSLIREDENSEIKIVIPCGICQERLRYWGSSFQVAIQTSTSASFISLHDLSPHHWTDIYPKNQIHNYAYDHRNSFQLDG